MAREMVIGTRREMMIGTRREMEMIAVVESMEGEMG